jgi:hypothetical protein
MSDQAAGPHWTQVQVEIQTKEGPRQVPGLAISLCPGLAVTMQSFGRFDVTHIGTGKKLAPTGAAGWQRAYNAMLRVAELSLIADWSGDPLAVFESIKARYEDTVPFPGTRVTTRGVEREMTIKEWWQSCSIDMPKVDEFPWEGADSPAYAVEAVLDLLASRAAAAHLQEASPK